jgi:nucleotide-binding universal stress UspA family protein
VPAGARLGRGAVVTIVCGTDLSGRSRPAVAAAAALARRTGEALWLVHVAVGAELLERECRERLVDAAYAALDGEVARVAGSVPAGVQRRVVVGHAAREVLALAEGERAGLVVVSSQGHAASALYRVGGTSERIALESAAPVLVVRDAAPFEAWARGDRALRVVVGVDFTAASLSAVRWVKALRRAGPCDVVLAHVYEGVDVLRRYGRLGVPSLVEADPAVERLLERDVGALAGDLGGEGKVEVRVRLALGRLADHLVQLADGEGADLVAVGTHHKRGPARLWSVSSAVLHLGRMSVATVPTSPGTLLGPEGLPEVRRVLVATDLSESSSWAVSFAYALLGRRGGDVHLLHVAQGEGGGEEGAAAEAALAGRVRALAPAAAQREGIVTHVEIGRGGVVGAICAAAERLGVDVVCLGSRGESPIRGLLGSTVAGVLRESARPVLVVRPPAA